MRFKKAGGDPAVVWREPKPEVHMIGSTISHYRILEKLGEGGMGVVYKAQDTKLDRIVALKFLPSFLSSDTVEKERFSHEARAAAALTHQNVAVLYDVDDHEGLMFLSMELIEGTTIKELLQHSEPSISRVLDLAIQICDGLSAAHEKGIVHRDLKSDNVMVTSKGQVKIMDFGLAKLKGAGKLTKEGSTLGTAAYMSPEQAQGQDVDQRSDIFSFGVVLYELLTGNLPFKGEHHSALLYSLINEDPPPLARFNDRVSDELKRIVSKCLAKDRDERYHHADDIMADLRVERKRQEYTRAAPTAQTTRSPSSPEAAAGRLQRKRTARFFSPRIIVPVAVVLLAGALLWLQPWSRFESTGESPVDGRSIVVLPFTNLSDNKEDEFFSDGITEDILTQLTKINDLRVVSRTTAVRYKGTTLSIREIGQELGVASVLEGSVRRAGNRVRIVSQLIDARNDEHLWAETYDRELKDIFFIQSEVAQKIAAALRTELSTKELAEISEKPTRSFDAYTLYLQGRYEWRKRSSEGLQNAIIFFERAAAKDPGYALAYVGIADAYSLYPYYRVPGLSVEDAFDNAEKMARKALEIDPDLAEAHVSLGNVLKEGRWNWKEAEKEFKEAIALNQKYATAHQWYGEALLTMGRMDEAIHHARLAVELEPGSAIIQNNLGLILLDAKQYQEAERVLLKATELDPLLDSPWGNLRILYVFTRQYEKWLPIAKSSPMSPGDIALESQVILNPEHLEQLVPDLEKRIEGELASEKASYVWIASRYALVNMRDQALQYLELSARSRHPQLPYSIRGPFFMRYRDDPRFKKVLALMNLEQ
ncbi:MAG: protein kinase [Ignavibacteriales bacterium]|nr:protein kinase [Ignavibacteriales bacterium]